MAKTQDPDHLIIEVVEIQEGLEGRMHQESLRLLDRVTVEAFRLGDIPRGIDNFYDAFGPDPMFRYTGGTVPPSILHKTIMRYNFMTWTWTSIMLTIHHGVAVLRASPPHRTCLLERLLRGLIRIISGPMRLLLSAEQKKRNEEVDMKMKQLNKDAGVEEKSKDWVYLEMLFTAQKYQGQGFGSALVKTLTTWLDLSGQTSWVHALDSNEGFYNFHGFQTMGSITIAEENPEWHEDPFTLIVMVRYPKSSEIEKV
ncbi:hypothetical protein CPB83DRAFT_901698 [Crepidotus variabilis]|uniref:N-acetyltransferase domain-containing protein n=1 Tax=Crepidotus variabilis TaxID=179855 RepID=A0A9P6ETV3_9AGAR|nr:hypothetical protein CPB83DRAFT_901698 [Crepidotus variabilis]